MPQIMVDEELYEFLKDEQKRLIWFGNFMNERPILKNHSKISISNILRIKLGFSLVKQGQREKKLKIRGQKNALQLAILELIPKFEKEITSRLLHGIEIYYGSQYAEEIIDKAMDYLNKNWIEKIQPIPIFNISNIPEKIKEEEQSNKEPIKKKYIYDYHWKGEKGPIDSLTEILFGLDEYLNQKRKLKRNKYDKYNNTYHY